MIFKVVLVLYLFIFYIFFTWVLEANRKGTVYTSFLLLVLINIHFQHINKIVMTRISFIYKKTQSTSSTNLSDKKKMQCFRLKATQ